MKKLNWIYKLIFSIVLVAAGLIVWPQKQVKAQGGFPIYLLKADYVQHFYEASHANTEEFLVQYVIEGIVTDNINDYFFIFIHYNAMNKGLNRGRNSYGLERIEPIPSGNATEINVRFTFTRHFLNDRYGGYDYNSVLPLFMEDSAFYIEYDVYNWGYGEGFVDGRDYGRSVGYQEGHVDGWNEGYYTGYDEGHENGYNEGYEIGYEEGELDGYDEGYTIGYNRGIEASYDIGYNDGFNDGQAEGFEIGHTQGFNEGHAVGYMEGLNETTDKNFTRLLYGVFTGIGAFLGINLLPGISIGTIIAVPIIFGIIAFILGRRRGGQ